MFLFQLSSYDSPVLDNETAELLRQRLEAHSRQRVPGIWRVTDGLNTYAASGAGREKRRVRYRTYGVLLLVLGLIALVPGLTEPRTPALICAGVFGILAGFLNFCLARERKSHPVPASCRKEAEKLLAGRRSVDWSKPQTNIRFDETGMTILSGEEQTVVPYGKITDVFETEHLWLVVDDKEKAILLQKKDLITGEADAFFPALLRRKQSGQV